MDVGLRIEPSQGTEIVGAVGVVREIVQFETLALEGGLRRGPRLVSAIRIEDGIDHIKCRTDNALQGCGPVAVKGESPVNAADAVVIAIQFTIRVHQSQSGLLSKVATNAAHGKKRLLAR